MVVRLIVIVRILVQVNGFLHTRFDHRPRNGCRRSSIALRYGLTHIHRKCLLDGNLLCDILWQSRHRGIGLLTRTPLEFHRQVALFHIKVEI